MAAAAEAPAITSATITKSATARRKADAGAWAPDLAASLPATEGINESTVYPQAIAFATTKNMKAGE